MESGSISNAQISASSEYNYYFAAIHGRLQAHRGWGAGTNDINEWLQIDLRNLNTIVTGVATQGRSDHNSWVTKYKLQYSNDGANFQYYKEQGQNADKVRPTKMFLNRPLASQLGHHVTYFSYNYGL